MGLSDRERKLIVALAELGPLSGYDIHTRLKLFSNAHWVRVKANLGPEGAGFIRELEPEGRAKPYWLSPAGVLSALELGADPHRLEVIINTVYGGEEAEALLLLTSIAAELNPPREIWGYIGRLRERWGDSGAQQVELLSILEEVTGETVEVLLKLANHPVLAPLVAEVIGVANEELKKRMDLN